MLTYYITSLGLIPYFTSRAFVPLFATAAIGRFGPAFGPLADILGVRLLASMPSWASSNTALLVLGLLAAFLFCFTMSAATPPTWSITFNRSA